MRGVEHGGPGGANSRLEAPIKGRFGRSGVGSFCAPYRASVTCASILVLAGVVGAFGSVAEGCRVKIEQSPSEPPRRPQGVPNDALWVGGVDGGVFLLVRPARPSEPEVYASEIRDDHTGEQLYRGPLLLRPAGGGGFPVAEAAAYSGWDGNALHLSDGRRLVIPPRNR